MRLTADKVKVNGPKIDGSYTVTFEVGEYEQHKVAELMLIPQNTIIKLDINTENQDD